ncbi:hypothetical protein M758_1G063800 [Ceratodon purpureus]|nr:hypothetical protein M758_1G063800 [Ceratodon purpureus]
MPDLSNRFKTPFTNAGDESICNPPSQVTQSSADKEIDTLSPKRAISRKKSCSIGSRLLNCISKMPNRLGESPRSTASRYFSQTDKDFLLIA